MKTGYFDAVLSDQGVPIAATVTVYVPGTSTKATIYADKNGSAQKGNPFQTDAYGRFFFYATAGAYYDIEVSGTGITTFKLQSVSMSPVTTKAKARAYRNTDQTGIVDQTWTKVQLNQENDPGDNYDNVTNFRFTVPFNGYYDLNAHARLLSGSFVIDKRYMLSIFSNGVELLGAEICPGFATSNPSVSLSSWANLSAGDYIEVWFWHNAGQAVSLKGGWGNCFLTVHLLSA